MFYGYNYFHSITALHCFEYDWLAGVFCVRWNFFGGVWSERLVCWTEQEREGEGSGMGEGKI
jgi:hypothetical protein